MNRNIWNPIENTWRITTNLTDLKVNGEHSLITEQHQTLNQYTVSDLIAKLKKMELPTKQKLVLFV
jgi:hypothetical protein